MANTLLPDSTQTMQRLDSVACLLEWTRSMPAPARKRFFAALAECGDTSRQAIVGFLDVAKHARTTTGERQRALMNIARVLFPNSHESDNFGFDWPPEQAQGVEEDSTLIRGAAIGSQQAAFAGRLRAVMEAKQVSQAELADRVGCSQPAISQLLNRHCRPQKKTILKLAEALDVQAGDLWPDIDTAELLDAVADFQQEGYPMTEAEARALGDTSNPNLPKIQANPLPTRRR